jgi:hypothetical protein
MIVGITDTDVYTVWWISLALGLVVIVVVAILLTLEVRAIRRVLAGVEAIWAAGQRIANNTIHIDMLRYTNQTAAQILETAGGIATAASRIEHHAADCPGCPRCIEAHGVSH